MSETDMKPSPVGGSVDGPESSSQSELLTAALDKRLRWKTDLVILPLIVLTSTLAFLDKVEFKSKLAL